MSFGGIAY